MVVLAVIRIKTICELDYLLHSAVKIHLVLLVLSAFPILVGELKPDGAIVLSLSIVINMLLLSIALALLLYCRWQLRPNGYEESSAD